MNLGWKLAAAVKEWAPKDLLDTYHSERHPVGQRVMMHSLSQLALSAPGPAITALRSLVGELLQIPATVEHLALLLAGSDVRYDVGEDHRLAGRFVPDLLLSDGRRIADLFHGARPVLVDQSGGRAAQAARGWRDRVDVLAAVIPAYPVSAFLVRPDGYVAWAVDAFGQGDEERLRAALQRWFGRPAHLETGLSEDASKHAAR
jgi:hypothetical protein